MQMTASGSASSLAIVNDGDSFHAMNFDTTGPDYFAHADEEILVVLQCEHIMAVESADSIFSVPGIDAIFVGPHDLAASMRSKDGKPPKGEETTKVMKHILETCKKHKVAAGLHAYNAEEAKLRMEEGWQFVAIASELRMMLNGCTEIIKGVGLDKQKSDLAKY